MPTNIVKDKSTSISKNRDEFIELIEIDQRITNCQIMS